MALGEADTCRKFIVPLLQQAGWDTEPHTITEQRTFTDGRVMFFGGNVRRGKQKRADYLLRYHHDFPIAVVEAKARYKSASDGVQQAKDYAEILGIKFAYASNGSEIIEFDYITGVEKVVSKFPTPFELWARLRAAEGLEDEKAASRLLTPTYPDHKKPLRYYQEIAVNRAVQAILQGRRRNLLTLCTGSGKTAVAFQICWKLWSGRWNKAGEHRTPKILFLADRNVLVDDPHAKDFAPFGDARYKIGGGVPSLGRDMYFAIYQAIAEDDNRDGLFRSFPKDFFDLIVIDECHRGSANEKSTWRDILEYFEPSYQLGMTATPRREENVNTYAYFGDPLYVYSLAQGIADGFLAPYRVHRIITDTDAAGWRPSRGELDRYGREIPDDEYETKDFERIVALRARTQAIARHLTTFMKATDRFAKTIVFCVDQEHASEMRHALITANADIMRDHPNYVCRVTADEGDVGKGHLSSFQDIESQTPVILTTSQLLTTGVDAPTCKNVVLARVVGSMSEFKQIIGRGTRLKPEYGKLYFHILDYTGTATEKFAEPSFDGDPAAIGGATIDEAGDIIIETPEDATPVADEDLEFAAGGDAFPLDDDDDDGMPRKFFVDGGRVEVIHHLVYDLDADGKKLTCRQLTDYTGDKVRTLYPNPADFRHDWLDPERRALIVNELLDRGIDVESLGETLNKPEADPFDLLCHLAYNSPLRSRRERADRVRHDEALFFAQYGPEARAVLDALLEKYTDHGEAQFRLPDALEVAPLNNFGNVIEIAERFGGAPKLREAVNQLNNLLYVA